jgi:hypothetical protein
MTNALDRHGLDQDCVDELRRELDVTTERKINPR